MRASYIAALLFVLASIANIAQADGLLYKLPKDGTWATYQCDATAERRGQQMRLKGTIRMASVGQVTEDGQPCRWIEVTMVTSLEEEGRPQSQKRVFKVLVPEKYLVAGKSPLEHVLRGWEIPSGKKEPQKKKYATDTERASLQGFLSGPSKDVRRLPKAEVASKLGKLPCEGVTGNFEFKDDGDTVRFVLENRLHPDAPFGVVTSRWTIETRGRTDGEVTKQMLNLKLVDFGNKASSEMPGAQ